MVRNGNGIARRVDIIFRCLAILSVIDRDLSNAVPEVVANIKTASATAKGRYYLIIVVGAVVDDDVAVRIGEVDEGRRAGIISLLVLQLLLLEDGHTPL